MNKTKILILCTAALLLVILAGTAYAAVSASGFAVDWWVFSGGGAPSSVGSFSLNSSLGQNVMGTSSSANYSLDHGYWMQKGAVKTFMPLITK
jgi:hypothetical protein